MIQISRVLPAIAGSSWLPPRLHHQPPPVEEGRRRGHLPDHRDAGRRMTLSVSEIETMDRVALIAAWDHRFSEPVLKSPSQAFLRRSIAFEVRGAATEGCRRGS